MRGAGLLALAVLGCSTGEASRLAVAVRDTLPGGVPRVMSPGPTAQADTSRPWRLVASDSIHPDMGSPGELIHPQALALAADGTLFLVDARPGVVKVYAPDGTFVRTIGREGEGPGEFRVAFPAVHQDRLVLHDPRTSRTSVFDTAGTFLTSWPSSCCYWNTIAVDVAGRVGVPVRPPEGMSSAYMRHTLDGTLVDTIAMPEGPEPKLWSLSSGSGAARRMQMTMTVPLSPRMVYAQHPEGGLVYGMAQDFTLVRTLNGRDSAMVFGRAWTAGRIPDSVRTAVVERQVASLAEDWSEAQLREALSAADVPTAEAPYSHVTVDGLGHTWARVGVDDEVTPAAWDRFAPDGAWLGRVVADRYIPRYAPQAWQGEALVVSLEDEDGLPMVVRFTLERGEQ